ncbi:family 3 adenylate cyclase [Xenococcus sp. PCC 7305]|uniref:adenylate/guanylate cyclase domain-containing protein n=1 Tax=Xenococcus sp. PCC 7305 TaxID=102125 RepID=UPI0002ABEE45|nr:adenylate/guanylate cyclase domain-containing protein [Xenococcus sp. PCC 7305]ELS00894.1 family 3 adenylate cyclase [Xenococcus sp. PCC 7305]
MAIVNRFSIKSRLMVLLLLVSLGSVLTTGILSWLRFRKSFETRTFAQLTSIRASKANEIESYLRNLRSQVEILSADRMVVSAMVELNSAYQELQNQVIPTDWAKKIEDFYAKDFFPRLAETTQEEQTLSNYRPTKQVAQYLQYHYIANNSLPFGEKKNLADAQDKSDYSKFHSQYHPIFRDISEKFGYDDLFLIDFNTEEIIYSVEKETDFATGLQRGPYRRSNLATVVESVKDNPGQGFVQVVDFKPYAASLGAPAAFFASAIYNGPHIVGIVAIQLPVDELNNILTSNEQWDGLGETGEVYLVGADSLMRSLSRSLIQNPEGYEASLRDVGLSDRNIDLIKNLNTSILLQPVKTKASSSAIAGVAGTGVMDNYQGISVLSSYEGLKIEGLEWGIIAEVNFAEAFEPLYGLQTSLIILAAIILLLVILLSNIAAQNFVKPLQTLINATSQGEEGQMASPINWDRKDEFGQLGQALNSMLDKIAGQSKLLVSKDSENKALLLNFLPDVVVARVKQGESEIADAVTQVTVLWASITGLNKLSGHKSTREVATILNQLVNAFDEQAEQYGVEKQNTIGANYVAVCGLSRAYLDQIDRTVNFGLRMLETLQQINQQHQVHLGLRIGIHSGAMMAAIIGTQKFSYHLWGETVKVAANLNSKAGLGLNSIVVTQPIFTSLSEQHLFIPHRSVEIEDLGQLATWLLVTRTGVFDEQIDIVKTSFNDLLPEADSLAKIFYEQLYEMAPSVRSMFKGEPHQRQQQLLYVLQSAVKGLSNLEELVPKVQDFGRRYVGHRVKEKDYENVGEALLWSLKQKLGQDFTPEVQKAWAAVYNLLSGVLSR